MITDLTEGSPSKKLFWFSLPLLASVAFQQLYQMADSIIAGRFAGELALAAVGASFPITQLFVAVATGVNIGASVLVSQLFGAKKYLRMKSAVSTALLTTVAIALILTVIGVFATGGIMAALQTPTDVFADGALYLRVYVFGLLFLFIYNVCTGIFNAMGDSRTPLILLVLSSIANVALDLLFVAGFRWGVAGVAWATFIAQGAAGVLALLLLLRRTHKFETGGHFLLFSTEMLRRLVNYAVPSIAQQSFVSVGNVIIQYLVNGCGAAVMGGYSAAIKIGSFALMCCMSFASGLSSFVAQNIGARKLDRIGPGLRAGAKYSIGLAVVFTAVYLLFADKLVGVFVPAGSTSGVIAVGRQYLFVVVPFYVIVCIKFVCDSVLRGAGAMRPFMITTFSDLIIRVVLSIVLFQFWREFGIWLSWPLGWFLGTGLSVYFYRKGVWKKNLPLL
ncbi:MATE family efflux transporter [Butyricicoccus faecihominis]|uniref:MATE family efflux transporter n=1 Tax=Butyricicoccus faecihominis TaxID=1712515 RepID=UPI00247B1D8B|nr:MATE family efflux transporter [Butyricicoccus faecihominis]MCQ5129090.1 MATE family efflux transporter [Butyricicoccus faecihominis]